MEDQTTPKRILIVDDEDVVRALCTRLLRPLGHTVETAANAEEALAAFDRASFDLVLTDYRMPGNLDGLALGDAIKKRSPRTGVVLMTAFPAVDTAVRMLRIGASDYLIKPFEQAELVQCVRSCLSKSEAA